MADLSAAELFTVLTPSWQPHVLGTYRSFISTGVSRHLQAADLELALDWALKLEAGPSPQAFSRDFERPALADEIVMMALANISAATVACGLARVMMQRLRSYYGALFPDQARRFDSAIDRNPVLRHSLIQALMLEMDPDRKDASLLASLLRSEDVIWLVEQTLRSASTDDSAGRKFALLASAAPFDLADRNALERVYEAAEQNVLVAEQFAWLLKPVELDSQLASDLRAHSRAMQPSNTATPELDPPAAQRILDCLDRLDARDWDAWWQLNLWMLYDQQRQVSDEFKSDLTDSPGWKDAHGSLRARLLHGAQEYMIKAEPNNDRWFGTDTVYRPAFAGYRAFRLLHKESPSSLIGIDPSCWSRLAASIFAYPTSSDETIPQQQVIAEAYARVPKEILSIFESILSRAVARSEPGWIRSEVAKLGLCPSDELTASMVLGWLDKNVLTPDQTGPLLAEVLRRRLLGVAEFVDRFLKSPASIEETDRKRTLIVARELLLAGERGALAAIWPTIEADGLFGEALFLDLAQHGIVPLVSGGTLSPFTEPELGDLFLWLEQHFPRTADADHRGEAHYMGPRESVAQFRDAILQVLQSRGSAEAVAQVQRIKAALPQHAWLYTVVLNAQNEMLRKTWIPPAPGEILALLRNSESRLISTPNQLLDVLLESLGRLQREDLKGETGRAKFLWNETQDQETRRRKTQPKDEPTLSDYIKGFLEHDLKDRGIIVNREVEAFRPPQAGKGPATDIHVDVVIRRAGNPVRLKAVIEVKGCWNRDVKSLEAQLIDRYLRGPDCQHGIYLVVWFDLSQWDDADYRRKNAPAWTFSEIVKFFDDQASASSNSERSVRARVLDASYQTANPVITNACRSLPLIDRVGPHNPEFLPGQMLHAPPRAARTAGTPVLSPSHPPLSKTSSNRPLTLPEGGWRDG